LLLLGAGYDSRAYRLPEAAGINAFEVDHPATQAVKARLIDPPGRVRLVPVDLLRDELEPALATAGFDHSVRTVAVWEGVTNYLDAEAVDGTFRYLRGATPPGSRLIFTYIDKRYSTGRRTSPTGRTPSQPKVSPGRSASTPQSSPPTSQSGACAWWKTSRPGRRRSASGGRNPPPPSIG
jgi:methyltransferase (TIGR00027 family)